MPTWMQLKDVHIETVVLNEKDFTKALKEKLLEEAKEVHDAITKDELVEELADLKEVMLAIMRQHQVQESEVEKKRIEKRMQKGGFDKGVFSKWIALQSTNHEIQYYLSKKDLYPEITEASFE
jgi:predicted house-cleaning noncanonical NTP pyrophosphatase (MazG superfamily)